MGDVGLDRVAVRVTSARLRGMFEEEARLKVVQISTKWVGGPT
jgi:hypothetical protein